MANEAEKKYIEIMRQKTGEERIKIAMDLRRFVLKIAECSIRNKNPKISKEDFKKEVSRRINAK